MFRSIKEFFFLSNTEYKGALVLLFLIIIVFVAPRIYFMFQKTELVEDVEFQNWVNEINYKDSIDKHIQTNEYKESKKVKLFKFNPNLVSLQELKSLGFDNKLAFTILKYRKTAKFYYKSDLKKIYGLTDSIYLNYIHFIDLPNKEIRNKYIAKEKKQEVKIEYFNFDPNTVSYYELLKLGIDGKTANILLKYRSKGAVFYNKEDILQVYGFTECKYASIEDFIKFPEELYKKESKDTIPEENIKLIIDINIATDEDFKQLKGIGKYYANEIIEYRTKLGGFYKKEQLKEVYGITDELYQKIEGNLDLNDDFLIKKLDINIVEFRDLIRHPYINKELTIKILNLRKDIAGFLSLKDIKYYGVFTQEQLEVLSNYLEVKN